MILCLVGIGLSAQVSFTAVPNKTSAKVGERIQLSFILTTSQDLEFNQITFPSFSGFQMLGRNVGQNFSYTNGRMTKQYMETVILVPQKEGKFTIQSGVVIVDGEKYQSNPVTLQITAAEQKQKRQENHIVFMEVILDKNNVYPNENIHAIIKLYAKSYDALRRRTDLEVPGMSNFQVKEISRNQDRDFKQESIQNQVYISEQIAEYHLMPTSSGELLIPSFTLRVAIPLGFFEERVVEVKSDPKTIFVNEFPANAPSSFNGAVGNFRLETHLDNNTLNAKESAIYEVELIGTGNFSNIDLPKISNQENLEIYPSKTRNAFQITSSGERGKLVDRYVMVPQYGGNYTIPALKFCFFDPSTQEYKMLYTDSEELKVAGESKEEYLTNLNESKRSDSIGLDSANEKTIISEIPREITNMFKKPNSEAQVLGQTKHGFNWWYAGIAGIALAGILWFFIFNRSKNNKNSKNSFSSQQFYASKFKTDLKELNVFMKFSESQSFLKKYQELLNDIVIYHHGETRQFSMQEAKEILSDKVSADYANRWMTLYKDIQTMSYGLAASDLEMQDKYNSIEILIKESLNS